MRIFQIADVAEKLKISKQTIMRYEKKGIFPHPRRNRINRWREYSEEDIKRMEHILGRGVTIIELVMVMLIIGILAGLVIPRFESFYTIKLNGAVKKVISDIRYTQQMAISRHTNTRLVFNTTGETYSVQEDSGGNWIALLDPFTRRSLQMDFTNDPQYKRINIYSVDFGGSNILQFNWQGAPVSGGSVGFRYSNNSPTLTISVIQNTGTVVVQ